MILKYKNTDYTFEELYEEQQKFEDILKVPNFLQADFNLEFFCYDPSYKLAMEFFNDLYGQITSSRFALIMGHKKLHDSNYIKWNSGEIGQYWLRFEYLKNSINWYNSSFDILWQVIWFGFALYRNIEFKKTPKLVYNIDSPATFKILQKRCRLDYIITSLKKENSAHSKELLLSIEKFNSSSNQKIVRKWANSLKHHGSFKIKELHSPSSALKVGNFDSRYVQPIIIEIDIITEVLKEYHIAYYELIQYIFDFFNFEGMQPPLQNGKRLMTKVDEKEYKKIIIKQLNHT